MPPSSISVVLPAYQLGDVITENARRVASAVAGFPAHEIVIVDDGSTDDTADRLAALAASDDQFRIVTHQKNRGKGEALISGWKAASHPIAVFLDADLDLPPEQIPGLVERLDEVDVVVGTKREAMRAGKYPRFRTFLSQLYSGTTSRMFGLPVNETQTGLKAFRKEALDTILPQVKITGYAFDLELLVRAHRAGYTIEAAPVELSASARSASFRPSMAWELGRDALRLVWWSRSDRGLRPRR